MENPRIPEGAPDDPRHPSTRPGDDATASDQLLPLVYDELKRLARVVFMAERPGHTLQPTALANEAWLKLRGRGLSVESKREFLMIAGRAMRQVLADYARKHGAAKRGGDRRRVTLDTPLEAAGADAGVDLIDLADCLERLAECNERHARVVELRLFSGLSIEETADALGLSKRSIDADWAMARTWLQRELTAER